MSLAVAVLSASISKVLCWLLPAALFDNLKPLLLWFRFELGSSGLLCGALLGSFEFTSELDCDGVDSGTGFFES